MSDAERILREQTIPRLRELFGCDRDSDAIEVVLAELDSLRKRLAESEAEGSSCRAHIVQTAADERDGRSCALCGLRGGLRR